uniref:Vomeronasal type-1 receptor n=1 Tax=Ornithorhynchus anatinus TaxID=9258 RepID=F7C218_ORNAN
FIHHPHQSHSTYLIFAHLAMANTIILLTSGLLETMSAWGLRNFLNNIGCKILLYLYRVSRGLAICTTCLLSIFQAITISPGTSRWVGVKARLPKCIIPCCLFSWIFNLLLEMITPMNFTGPQNNSSVRYPLDLKYCSRVSLSATINQVVAVVLSTRDLLFVALMSVASGYMVYVLCRHHRRVQHLHRPGHSPRAMPEVTAAKRVVALVMLYVLLYCLAQYLGSMDSSLERENRMYDQVGVRGAKITFIHPFIETGREERVLKVLHTIQKMRNELSPPF